MQGTRVSGVWWQCAKAAGGSEFASASSTGWLWLSRFNLRLPVCSWRRSGFHRVKCTEILSSILEVALICVPKQWLKGFVLHYQLLSFSLSCREEVGRTALPPCEVKRGWRGFSKTLKRVRTGLCELMWCEILLPLSKCASLLLQSLVLTGLSPNRVASLAFFSFFSYWIGKG